METEARMSREAWVRSTEVSDLVRCEVMSLRTTVLGIGDSFAGTGYRITGTAGTRWRSYTARVTRGGDRRAHAYTRHLMETEARMSQEAWVRSTEVSDLVRCEVMSLRTTVLGQMTEIRELHAADRRRQTVILELLRTDHRRSTNITEDSLEVLHSQSYQRRLTVGHEAAYGMSWKTLMKMMTKKYCPRNKIRKLEMELWDLK
nr:reverse transcriptase domain-containing protein [Tanacetum cinerariifolium]